MEESLRKQIKNISIKQENTMLMKHLFKLLIFQYEITAWRSYSLVT
jgi:hypothetical protein